MVKFYALMCVLGTVLPYGALVGWSVENGGWDVAAMLAEIAGSRMSLFAWADVLVSAVVLIAFIRQKGRRASVPGLWLPIAGTCAVGVSRGGKSDSVALVNGALSHGVCDPRSAASG